MSIAFSAVTKELLDGLTRLRAVQKGGKKTMLYLPVDLDLYADGISLTCTGATLLVKCLRENKDRYRATIPLEHFYQIVKAYPKSEITVSFEGNKMTCGNVTIGGIRISELPNPSTTSDLNLPINYTDKDLLRLKYNFEEKVSGGLSNLILQAEARLDQNISKTLTLLGEYGVSSHDLLELVSQRVKE